MTTSSPLSTRTRGVVAGMIGVALALTGLTLASPAQAATSISISTTTGTVGVDTAVQVSLGSGAPAGQMSLSDGGAVIATKPMGGSEPTSSREVWHPTKAGTATLTATFTPADGSAPSTATKSVSVRSVSTTTKVSTPTSSAGGNQVSVTATVKATSGDYVPTGSVTFTSSSGQHLGKAQLDGSGQAHIDYAVSATASKVGVYASYAGDGSAQASKSSAGYISVTPSATGMTLKAPESVTVGSTLEVSAHITPAVTGGSVTFSIGGKAYSPRKVTNGVATNRWTMSDKPGTRTITARFSGYGSAKSSTATITVRVVDKVKPDPITITPEGAAAPWVAGQNETLTNGADAKLVAKSGSGAPVTLTVSGPCVLVDPVTVHVNGVGGTCQVTATSPGGNGFSASTVSYAVYTAAGAQTATVNPPADRARPAGTVLKLAPVKARTNVGQEITWRVTAGKKACSITRKGGFVQLNLLKKGQCTVTGTAPAISDQWSPFSITREYTVKPAR